jgi:hypothetical protein
LALAQSYRLPQRRAIHCPYLDYYIVKSAEPPQWPNRKRNLRLATRVDADYVALCAIAQPNSRTRLSGLP